MSKFNSYVAIDWSGAKGSYDGISVARAERGEAGPSLVPPRGARWTRTLVAEWLGKQIRTKERILVGFDFAFGVPMGSIECKVAASDASFPFWEMVEEACTSDPDFGCVSFLRDPRVSHLYWTSGKLPAHWTPAHRLTEKVCVIRTGARAETVFKLIGSKQVGKASLTGVRVLRELRMLHAGSVTVWPFEVAAGSVFVEIFPTVFRKQATGDVGKIKTREALNAALRHFNSGPAQIPDERISDHDGDALISAAALRSVSHDGADALPGVVSDQVRIEGWIFGIPYVEEGKVRTVP